ncbi:hypothetical protein COLO4_36878 [Corchorus olitorius]|uniref:Uncharacterized protein n=1 Tax=Corchorus olitorius TaxID=93759 RepID=A0A1R3G4P0_9ROSI|nr:hypothetical protein COLO4_36878 [Corchorus olitorius]
MSCQPVRVESQHSSSGTSVGGGEEVVGPAVPPTRT